MNHLKINNFGQKKNIVDDDKIKMPPEMKQLLMDCLSENAEIADYSISKYDLKELKNAQ